MKKDINSIGNGNNGGIKEVKYDKATQTNEIKNSEHPSIHTCLWNTSDLRTSVLSCPVWGKIKGNLNLKIKPNLESNDHLGIIAL